MSVLLALLPGLIEYLPHILTGGGLVATLAGLLPAWRTYSMIGLAVLLAGAVGYGLLERGNYQAEVAARAKDNEAAEQAALQQIERDRQKRAEVDARYQADLSQARQEASNRERTIRSAPASAGPVSPAWRAFYDSVRNAPADKAGGGQAGRGPAR